MAEIASNEADGKPLEIWFADEARIGQKNKITRRWARRGTRPSAPRELPAKAPELNPVENIWQYLRENWISNRVFTSYTDILDHCCEAWNDSVS